MILLFNNTQIRFLSSNNAQILTPIFYHSSNTQNLLFKKKKKKKPKSLARKRKRKRIWRCEISSIAGFDPTLIVLFSTNPNCDWVLCCWIQSDGVGFCDIGQWTMAVRGDERDVGANFCGFWERQCCVLRVLCQTVMKREGERNTEYGGESWPKWPISINFWNI